MDFLDVIGTVPTSTLVLQEKSLTKTTGVFPELRVATRLYAHTMVNDKALDVIAVMVSAPPVLQLGRQLLQQAAKIPSEFISSEPGAHDPSSYSGIAKAGLCLMVFLALRSSLSSISTPSEPNLPLNGFSTLRRLTRLTKPPEVVADPFRYWEGNPVDVKFNTDSPITGTKVTFAPQATVRHSDRYGDLGHKAAPWVLAPTSIMEAG